jgi:glycosyltransferase involved in cell wall biosynthesis
VGTPDGRHVGIPNVLMEAMSTGLPVITTRSGGQAELIEGMKDGLFVAQRSPVELADAIERLCRDLALRDGIAGAARKKMEIVFDSRRTIEPLVRLLKLNTHVNDQPDCVDTLEIGNRG